MTTTYGLSIVKPMVLTDAMLVSTNVPEADYAAWAVGTTYALGARVIVVAEHAIYESLQAGNVGKVPSANAAWWIKVSPTNRWKCFDTSNSTSTANATSISYTIRPGISVTSVAMLNVVGATSVRVRLVDPTYGTVFDDTSSFVSAPTTSNWWAWFFGQRSTKSQYVSQSIPSYPNADLLIDLYGNATLAVGVILLGQQTVFGEGIKYGARVGIQDYSRKETNDYGDTTLVERAYAKRANFSMMVARAEVDALQAFLASVRATPCLWIGSSLYEATVVFGFYKTFEILISYPQNADCDLEIEGLT